VARRYVHDGLSRNLIEEVDGLGFVTSAEYDGYGNRITRTDRLGNSEAWRYNTFGQPTEHTDQEGRIRTWRYDARGNLLAELAVVDGRQEILREYRYDARGNRTESREYLETGGATPLVARFEYDPDGIALVRTVDPAGAAVRFSNDALGRPYRTETERTLSSGGVEYLSAELSYDALDRVVRTVDPARTATRRISTRTGSSRSARSSCPYGCRADQAQRVDAQHAYDAADAGEETRVFPSLRNSR
jgi:YD repeat-containing protein